ncbi:L-lactate permease [Bosea sp. 685]|uniref:L-lactate permease n=1 Tax=Bosea sp. 685 TaxID=3080057 RepID=UPI002892A5B0|nr:L-lactate permease [Bosea sp. 685]WNJ87882.1 L-lactate permease [Bosea sp. 685]
MNYLLWALPTLAVVGAVAHGRIGILVASIIGVISASIVALTAAPQPFFIHDALASIARGAWIGWVVVPYILGGLLFWQLAIQTGDPDVQTRSVSESARARRRLLFAACFLIGPFAESATGFGVGIVGTMVLVRRLGVQPIYLLAFSLLSQTLILWGGMSSGILVAAAFARTDPTRMAVNVGCILAVLNILWLPIFWRMADRAGVAGGWRERINEVLWLCGSLASVIAATAWFGAEAAMLATYGPIIVVRYLLDERPSGRQIRLAIARLAPVALLIALLVVIRLSPPLRDLLQNAARIQPFQGAPVWWPLFHAGSWLIVAAILTAVLRARTHTLGTEMAAAWRTGRLAVLTVITFAMMAELLSGSGIAGGLARGLFDGLGRWAVVLTLFISAIFGALANTGNAANGLFMAPQISLATDAGLNVEAVIALQHAAALSLNIVSPVRMSIVCALAGTPGHERDAYRMMMPFVWVVVAALLVAGLIVVLRVV